MGPDSCFGNKLKRLGIGCKQLFPRNKWGLIVVLGISWKDLFQYNEYIGEFKIKGKREEKIHIVELMKKP